MPDPVSWLMIEPGWAVISADGEDLGKVHERIGDSNADIFDGLAVSTGLLSKPRYVPAEQVGEIVEGTVRLTIVAAVFGREQDFEEGPPSEEILPETASRSQRLLHYVKRGLFLRD